MFVILSSIFLFILTNEYTVKILSEARAFIRIITIHGDGGGPLLEATSARKSH